MQQWTPRGIVLAILSAACMISASIMLSVGHAVAYGEYNRYGMERSATERYYQAFRGLLTGGIALLIVAAVLAAGALWTVLRRPNNPPSERTGGSGIP